METVLSFAQNSLHETVIDKPIGLERIGHSDGWGIQKYLQACGTRIMALFAEQVRRHNWGGSVVELGPLGWIPLQWFSVASI
jgi:hypothetical protein